MVSDLTGFLDEVEGHAALAAGEEGPDMYAVVAFLGDRGGHVGGGPVVLGGHQGGRGDGSALLPGSLEVM